MALDPKANGRVNLGQASILLLDDNPLSMEILAQIVTGLGAKRLHRCGAVEEARDAALSQELDLAIVDGMAPSGKGYDFVSWLRREAGEPNCFIPVMVTTAHTPGREVARARDCGGHIIIKKPIAPIVLLERIAWASRGGRPFLLSDGYVGPDRRFREGEAPNGLERRRGGELAAANAPETRAAAS